MKKVINAQEKDVWMYVAEDATYATGNQAIFKASDFIGAGPTHAARTRFYFRPQDKTHLSGQDFAADMAPDYFELEHTVDACIEVLKTVGAAMANPHGGFVVIQDYLGTAYTTDGSSLGNAMTDLDFPPIASTGTAVSVSGVSISTVDA